MQQNPITDYQLTVEFNSQKSHMSGIARLDYQKSVEDGLKFYLHGELRVDSIKKNSGNPRYSV